jgi:hypothetical protein
LCDVNRRLDHFFEVFRLHYPQLIGCHYFNLYLRFDLHHCSFTSLPFNFSKVLTVLIVVKDVLRVLLLKELLCEKRGYNDVLHLKLRTLFNAIVF